MNGESGVDDEEGDRAEGVFMLNASTVPKAKQPETSGWWDTMETYPNVLHLEKDYLKDKKSKYSKKVSL